MDFHYSYSLLGNTVKFEKRYKENNDDNVIIKMAGKIVEGTKITGKWWSPGHKRLRGTFFMWNKQYEVIFKSQFV